LLLVSHFGIAKNIVNRVVIESRSRDFSFGEFFSIYSGVKFGQSLRVSIRTHFVPAFS